MKFESFKTESGGFRWRLREEGGQVVSVKSGKIMGLDSSPSTKKVSERTLTRILERLADGGRGDGKRRSGAAALKRAKG